MNVTEKDYELNMTLYNATWAEMVKNITTSIVNDISNVTDDSIHIDNVTETPYRQIVTQSCSNTINTTPDTIPTSHDALLYIVVVLLFYAFSMVILMVKYIRREREEAEMAHYYSEFVSRDRFKTPMFEIRNCMQGLKIKHSKQFVLSSTDNDDDDFVSCSEVPLVGKDHRIYIGEETRI